MLAICERVVTKNLASKAWAGEEETIWSCQIAEEIKAEVTSARRTAPRRAGPPPPPALTHSRVLARAELDLPRYKIVVQVAIGEKARGVMVGRTAVKTRAITGVRVASRCLWDTDTDNYASYSFSNVRACVCVCACARGCL